MTLRQLLDRFATEEACKVYLVQKRWPDGIIRCPRCGNEKVFHVTHRPFHWVCKSGKTVDGNTCHKRNGYRFSVISKTIFENTNYPLREWFKVAFLMFNSKKGMSAHQIHRMLGTGSYETAWFMCHRLRAAMRGSVIPPLGSDGSPVEVDETYIGGKNKFRHGNKKHGRRAYGGHDKVPVIGAIARKGNVICQALEEVGFDTYERFVKQAVSSKARLLATDEHSGYRHLSKRSYEHWTVNHSEKQYVVGTVHTNTIESFWSLLKRGIIGSYHHVNREYLPLYLNEFSFRFNNRKNEEIFEELMAGC